MQSICFSMITLFIHLVRPVKQEVACFDHIWETKQHIKIQFVFKLYVLINYNCINFILMLHVCFHFQCCFNYRFRKMFTCFYSSDLKHTFWSHYINIVTQLKNEDFFSSHPLFFTSCSLLLFKGYLQPFAMLCFCTFFPTSFYWRLFGNTLFMYVT